MKNPDSVHPAVSIDSQLLKQDRKAAGFTQSSFAASCDSVSLATVRRAEQGHRVIETSLRRMAEVLGHPVERYIASDPLEADTIPIASIAGEWTGFYVEADLRGPPYIVEQDLTLRQNGGQLEGDIVSINPLPQRIGKINGGRTFDRVVTGQTHFEGRRLPVGLANFYKTVSREGNWLEGFCSWIGPATEQVENSRIIAVRKNQPRYSQYIEEARKSMETEKSIYRLRKLTEVGYLLDDAVNMLSSLDIALQPAPPAPEPNGSYQIEGEAYLARTGTSYIELTEKIVELDHRNISGLAPTSVGTAAQWVPLFRDSPECWRILTKDDEIVGYWHMFALRPEAMGLIKAGALREVDIKPADTESFGLPGAHSVLVTSLIATPEARFGRPFKLLFDSIFVAIEELANHDIFIDEVLTAAWTPASNSLARRLGFENIGEIQQVHGATPLYQTDMPTLLKRSEFEDFPVLRQTYLKR